MPKFMLILGGADLDKRSSSNPAIAPKMLESYMGWVKSLTDRGPVVSSYKLYDQTGARLTIRGGQVVDGPFVEAKEAVGGVFVIEAASLAEATALERSCRPRLRLPRSRARASAIAQPARAARAQARGAGALACARSGHASAQLSAMPMSTSSGTLSL